MSKDITKYIKEFGNEVGPDLKVLDVGCGLRPYEYFFSHCKYTGIDVEQSGRKTEDKKPDKYYDGSSIPFESSSFDIVICTQVIEHCLDSKRLLSEIHRILRPTGKIFLTVPFMWGEHEIPYDFRRYSSYGIKGEIEDAGFKVIKQNKLTEGVKAIEVIVNSEINNYKAASGKKNKPAYFGILDFVSRKLWKLVNKIWERIYSFDRIYLDNLIVAEKINIQK